MTYRTREYIRAFGIFLFVLVAGLASAAFAQTVTPDACGTLAKNIKMQMTEAPILPSTFSCAPSSVGGTGSFPRLAHNSSGWVAWHYCTDGFSYTYQFAAVTDEYLAQSPDLALDWAAVQFAADHAKAVNDFAAKHITMPLTDPKLTPVWCPSIHQIVAATPPPVAYIVKPDPSAAYRATYMATTARNGTRISTTVPYDKVAIKNSDGSPRLCNCMKTRLIEGSNVFCTADDTPLAVTACVKQ